MKAVYLDCFSGISGNMMVGALLDAGVSYEHLATEVGKLPVASYRMIEKRVVKRGVNACCFSVKTSSRRRRRSFDDVREIIQDSSMAENVKARVIGVFARLTAAEAKVMGIAVDKVRFHEVGAVDSIFDVVGAIVGLEYLGIEHVRVSALNVGAGFLKCRHGLMPVPAPATAELLKEVPFYGGDIEGELVTPTGAALVACLADSFGQMPASFRMKQVAYGAGDLDLPIPNVLRLYIGEMEEKHNDHGEVKIVETNIDDMNPQLYGYIMDKLFAHGAYDVYLVPIVMKKGRPGTKISALVPNDRLQEMIKIFLCETSSLGVRILDCATAHVKREIVAVDTDWGRVSVKLGRLDGNVVNVAPEYEDCRGIAEMNGIPLKMVHGIVLANCGRWMGATAKNEA